MKSAQPIRNKEQLYQFMHYYKEIKPNPRNDLLLTIGFNTALRVSDLLSLQWEQVYDSIHDQCHEHIILIEQKTHKHSQIKLNTKVKTAIIRYRKFLSEKETIQSKDYLFKGRTAKPISRTQAYRIMREVAIACQIEGTISPHSMRKTFGYHAWKANISPVLIMNIYNHSSYTITKRYLGIEQDDKDQVFEKICL